MISLSKLFRKRGAIEIEWEQKKRELNSEQYRNWLETREGLSMFCELVKYDISRCGKQLKQLNAMSAEPKPAYIAECRNCGLVPVDKPISRTLNVCPYCSLVSAIKEGYVSQIRVH